MSGHSIKWWDASELKKVTNTSANTKKKALARYIKRKIESGYRKLDKKQPKTEVYNE